MILMVGLWVIPQFVIQFLPNKAQFNLHFTSLVNILQIDKPEYLLVEWL